MFAIQDEIAAKVAAELAVTLKADEQERLVRRHTDNLEAYETYLRTRRLGGFIRDASRRAARMRLAERVIELDPNFAGGYSSVSAWLALRVRLGQSASPQEDIERAFKLAVKAVAIDPTFAPSHTALGNVYLMKRKHSKAVAAAREALRIQPNFANGYLRLSYFLHWSGRGEEAIEAVKTAIRLDPKPKGRRKFTYPAYLGSAEFTAGRYRDAIATIGRDYAFRARVGTNSLCFLAAAYIATGQAAKARAALKAFLKKNPNTTLANYRSPRLYKRAEDRDRYLNLLRKAGMPEK